MPPRRREKMPLELAIRMFFVVDSQDRHKIDTQSMLEALIANDMKRLAEEIDLLENWLEDINAEAKERLGGR